MPIEQRLPDGRGPEGTGGSGGILSVAKGIFPERADRTGLLRNPGTAPYAVDLGA